MLQRKLFSPDEHQLYRNLCRRRQRAKIGQRPWHVDTWDVQLASVEMLVEARECANLGEIAAAARVLADLWDIDKYRRHSPGLGYIGCDLTDALTAVLTCSVNDIDDCDSNYCINAWVYQRRRALAGWNKQSGAAS